MRRRTVQICFYSAYCMLALVGFLADLGVFSGRISANCFVYYTSLSNLACTAFMLVSLIKNIKVGDNGCGFAPACKYIFVVMILITALLYNLILSPYRSLLAYFASVKNGLYHLILPVLFFLDWLIFYKRGTVKPLYPLLAMTIPFAYVVCILTRASIVKITGMPASILYPYFFLNLDSLGWYGFLTWMGVLFVALVALGYMLYALDQLLCRKNILAKI